MYIIIIEGKTPKVTNDEGKALNYIHETYSELDKEFAESLEQDLIETGYVENGTSCPDMFFEAEEL